MVRTCKPNPTQLRWCSGRIHTKFLFCDSAFPQGCACVGCALEVYTVSCPPAPIVQQAPKLRNSIDGLIYTSPSILTLPRLIFAQPASIAAKLSPACLRYVRVLPYVYMGKGTAHASGTLPIHPFNHNAPSRKGVR